MARARLTMVSPLATCLVLAFEASAGTLIVLNKADASASLIDSDAMTVAATVKTGVGPHEVAVSSEGKTAVVANYGDVVPGRTLTVIDLTTATVASTVDLGKYSRPHGISFIGGSNEVLVTSEDEQCVVRVDLVSGKVVRALRTGQKTSHMLAIDAAGNRAFVANIGSGSITVLNLATNEKIRDLVTGKGAEGIDYNEEQREVWVANRAANTIAVIDAVALKLKRTLRSEAFPIRVRFTPDHKRALVTNAQSGTLTVFDAATKQALKTIHFPRGTMDTAGKMFGDQFKDSSVPIGIAFDPRRGKAFVAHASLDQISILDLQRLELDGSLRAGREPDGMAYSEQSRQR